MTFFMHTLRPHLHIIIISNGSEILVWVHLDLFPLLLSVCAPLCQLLN